MRHIKIEFLYKCVLLRIYKKFKKYPNQVFSARDFSIEFNRIRQTYLDVLIKLGLIKEVKVIFFCGRKHKVKHEKIGYKLNNPIIIKK